MDDVPMDSRALAVLERIAEENGLHILTSLTGDFNAENLKDGEILVQNGELLIK